MFEPRDIAGGAWSGPVGHAPGGCRPLLFRAAGRRRLRKYAPYHLVVSKKTPLPAGLLFSTSGLVQGIPLQPVQNDALDVGVTDSGSPPLGGSGVLSITVGTGEPWLDPTVYGLLGDIDSVLGLVQCATSGGFPPLRYCS